MSYKLPNGFGSVYKLSGKRRKPWAARKTVGWNDKGQPIYTFVGYYASRSDALTALADYNRDPYDLHYDTITFSEVFERWSKEKFPTISKSNQKGYLASYHSCGALYQCKMTDIKLDHLQKAIDDSGKNTPTLKKIKQLFGQMWDYCVIHEILPKDKRDMIQYIDVSKPGNPKALNRSPFSKDEIDKLWKMVDGNERIMLPLVLIYTGLRIGELYNLKKEDVHIEEKWFQVTEAKTAAGIREVPIADKILPFFRHWLEKDSDYVFPNSLGKKHVDKTFRGSWWMPVMDELRMEHLPHDTRHTCVSLLTEAGVDPRIIRQIVGHKGQGVTEAVYTHMDMPAKLEAINKI